MTDTVYALAASPSFAQDGVCFVGRDSGLYRSHDGGVSWDYAYGSLNLDSPLPTTTVAVSPNFAADRRIFAGIQGGILCSSDGGQTWQAASLGLPPPFVSTLMVSPCFGQDGTVVAGTLGDGLFRSVDRGKHWQAANFGLLDLNVLSLAISPVYNQDETIFAGSETGLFRSTNGGRAWREVSFPCDNEPILSLAYSPSYSDDGTLFAGTETAGLFCSGDRGQTWRRIGENAAAMINAILLAPRFPEVSDILVLSGDQLRISRNSGQTWTDWKVGTGQPAVTAVVAPGGLDSNASLLVGLSEDGPLRL
jgi:photosystem II stability/assembly factor-like uncharacterized protein